MYLVDTNIWLERLLGQEQAEAVGRFLNSVASSQLLITDFSFHSICVILIRERRRSTLETFVKETLVDAGVQVVRLSPDETALILLASDRFGLDFDDAYQYAAAEKLDLVLVSFDKDFDRTERGRILPSDV